MSQTQPRNASPIGLDIGTSRIVTAQRSGEEYTFNSQLNAFVDVPFSPISAGVLKKESIPHTLAGNHIVIHGNESERFANVLGVDVRRPMSQGVLNAGEPESLEQIRRILGCMLEPGKGARLYFSVPAPSSGGEEQVKYHEASLMQYLTELGYRPVSINEGLAVVYSELESTNYTGIGVSCGGGLCNVCWSYLAIPVSSFSVAKGGDYIDANAAAAAGDLATRIRTTKEESFHFNGYFADKSLQALSVYYDELIETLVKGMKDRFLAARIPTQLKNPVPLVLSGGTVLPSGFRDRFEKALRASDFPLEISEVRMAAKPLEATARGALIAALSES